MQLRKLLVLLVVFGIVAAAFAHDGPESESQGPRSDGEGPESEDDGVKREFQFNIESNQIEVEVKMKGNRTESKLKHKIVANDNGVEFRVAYQQESGRTESELRLRVRLFQLVEYIPDSTPGYQNETMVNSYSQWNWGNGFQDTTSGSNQKVITLKTADGIFTLVLRVNVPAAGSPLSFKPEDVKFDIELDADAMRAAGWLNGTEVALRAVLASRLKSEKEHDDDNKQTQNTVNVGAPADLSGLFMSWVNYLECDNNRVSVVSSPLRKDDSRRESDDDSDSTANVVSFAFINLGDKSNSACVWDPVIGPKTGSAASIIASWVVIIAAIFAMF